MKTVLKASNFHENFDEINFDENIVKRTEFESNFDENIFKGINFRNNF